jgi:hypothetical protein
MQNEPLKGDHSAESTTRPLEDIEQSSTIIIGDEFATFAYPVPGSVKLAPELRRWAQRRGFNDQLNAAIGAAQDFLDFILPLDPDAVTAAQAKMQEAEQEYAELISRLIGSQAPAEFALDSAPAVPGVWIYKERGYSDSRAWLRKNNYPNLPKGFNDSVLSAKIYAECVLFYRDSNYGPEPGHPMGTLSRGVYPDLPSRGITGVSSIVVL